MHTFYKLLARFTIASYILSVSKMFYVMCVVIFKAEVQRKTGWWKSLTKFDESSMSESLTSKTLTN